MKRLPIGIQDFSELRINDCLYVDKTQDIYQLIENLKGYYFLSRPRRFGKSLLISVLEEIFTANKELFKGLWIEQSDYQWPKHPVIRIDFSKLSGKTPEILAMGVNKALKDVAQKYDVVFDFKEDIAYNVSGLLSELCNKTGQRVVILIDEYDSPIISNIAHPEVLAENKEQLASFYRAIKGSDKYLRFVFLTGVSKFAKVSVFSGLNNLRDITLDSEFATILGYTQEELERYFAEAIDELQNLSGLGREELLDNIRRWYNGYRFSKKEVKVYNPFSALLFFNNLEFENYWFETGTPTFLLELLKKNNYDLRDVHNEVLSSRDFNSYEVEKVPLIPLLFNTGYLTISGVEQPHITQTDYTLNYPNNEVRISFLEQFVDDAFTKGTNARNYIKKLTKSIQADNVEEVVCILKTFFSELPYDIQATNRNTEAYYQSLIYCVFKLLGYDTSAEERTNKGRADLVVEGKSSIYLFEMKVDKPAKDAIEQIKKRGYAEKYRLSDKRLHLVGLSFSSAERNIAQCEIEECVTATA